MKKLVFGLLFLGFATQAYSQIIQTEKLSEVTVYATNYKYLNSLTSEEPADISVELLQRKVATFNLQDSEFYQDDYDLYRINFFIPEGKILAAYDKDGKLLRTAERFTDVKLPNSVRESVAERFPGWEITKDVYLVNYHDQKGVTKKYKLKLVNGDKVLRVKTDEKGNFL